MDSQHFVKPTSPSFMPRIKEEVVERAGYKIDPPEKSTFQIDDIRLHI